MGVDQAGQDSNIAQVAVRRSIIVRLDRKNSPALYEDDTRF
jgi:hypothetical protein